MCQLIATSCICDPVTETIWPIHNKRKSRWRRDENALWRSVAPLFSGPDAGSIVAIVGREIGYLPLVPFNYLFILSTLVAANFRKPSPWYVSDNFNSFLP